LNSITPAIETKVLVFIVLEHRALTDGQRKECVSTDEIARHFGFEHKDAMKVINALRKKEMIILRERLSKGLLGNGYDGALFGALTPSTQGVERAMRYLRVDK
jgi:NCAIR mutase (PurE)-related protein